MYRYLKLVLLLLHLTVSTSVFVCAEFNTTKFLTLEPEDAHVRMICDTHNILSQFNNQLEEMGHAELYLPAHI